MKEQFVTYKLAKILKEKGFDEPCLGTYLTEHSIKEGKLYPAEPDCDITDEFDSDGYLNFVVIKNSDLDDVKQYLAAPLWQQAIDWFELKYGFNIWIDCSPNSQWIWTINFIDKGTYIQSDDIDMEDKIIQNPLCFNNKYEALEAVIKHALTLI